VWSGKTCKVSPKDITSLVLKVCQGALLVSTSLSLKVPEVFPS
jgi:hypothetical protein